MEKKKNLYKLDDFSLIFSVIIFIVFIFQFRSLLPLLSGSDFNQLRDGALNIVLRSPIRLGILLFSAIFFQIVGRVVRKKESISLKVIDAIRHRSRVSLSNLSTELGLDSSSLEKIIRQLAAIPGAGVSFDGNYVKIEKESNEPVIPADKTFESMKSKAVPTTLNNFTKEEYTDLKDLKDIIRQKQSSGNDESAEDRELRELQDLEKLENLNMNPKAREFVTSVAHAAKSGENIRPNPAILIFLFIVFWPAAIIYVIHFYMKNVQKKALKNEMNNS